MRTWRTMPFKMPFQRPCDHTMPFGVTEALMRGCGAGVVNSARTA